METSPVRILGIDPGTNVLGFAVVDADKKNIRVIEIGVVTFAHISDDHTVKLRYIFEQVQDLIQQYSPTQMAIEAPFFGKNVQSMLKLGRAQGVAIAAVSRPAITRSGVTTGDELGAGLIQSRSVQLAASSHASSQGGGA